MVPLSPEALEPVLKKAREAGIVVISHEATNQQNIDADIEAFVNEEYGAHMMDNLAKFMGGEGEWANFVGSLTSKSHNQWQDGAEARAKQKYPKMKLVSRRNEEYDDQNKAYQKSKELITAFPDLKGILGAASTTAPGAGLAVEEAGLQGKINVVGTSLVSSCGQYLKSGATKMILFWDSGRRRVRHEQDGGRPAQRGQDHRWHGHRREGVPEDQAGSEEPQGLLRPGLGRRHQGQHGAVQLLASREKERRRPEREGRRRFG